MRPGDLLMPILLIGAAYFILTKTNLLNPTVTIKTTGVVTPTQGMFTGSTDPGVWE